MCCKARSLIISICCTRPARVLVADRRLSASGHQTHERGFFPFGITSHAEPSAPADYEAPKAMGGGASKLFSSRNFSVMPMSWNICRASRHNRVAALPSPRLLNIVPSAL